MLYQDVRVILVLILVIVELRLSILVLVVSLHVLQEAMGPVLFVSVMQATVGKLHLPVLLHFTLTVALLNCAPNIALG